MWERMGHSRSERELAADFVHDVVSSFLFGLDIHLAGLDADLVGQAVIGLGTVYQVGDVVLFAAVLNVDFRCQRRTAAMRRFAGLGSGFGGLVRFGRTPSQSFPQQERLRRWTNVSLLRHGFNLLSQKYLRCILSSAGGAPMKRIDFKRSHTII